MSELLLRGRNVSAPSVDIGDDMYVVEDANSTLTRVQVKAANCKKKKYGFLAHVAIKLSQLRETKKTPLIYIFALRFEEAWRYLIIRRTQLEKLHDQYGVGEINRAKNILWLRFKFLTKENKLMCSWLDFTKYLGWEKEFAVRM